MGLFFTIVVLGFVIFIHEMGHFLAALWMNVRVYEFCIGFGPKIIGFKRNNIDYSLRALPLGGFVRLAGMDDTEEQQSSAEDSYYTKSVFARMLIILAGSFVNILFGFLFFVGMALIIGIPNLNPVISSVVEGRAAYQAGLQKGDVLISVDNIKIENVRNDFIAYIAKSGGKEVSIVYQRFDDQYTSLLVPTLEEGENVARIGIVLESYFNKWSFISSLKYGSHQLIYHSSMVFKSISYLIKGKATLKDLAGPVGIVQMAAFQYDQGLLLFFQFMAMLSISLGVINLFPIPALDGGHFMFLLYEGVFSKKVPEKLVSNIQAIFMIILLCLMTFIVTNDVLNWSNRSAFFDSLK